MIDAEALDRLIEAGDSPGVAAALAPLAEAQRKKLRPAVEAWQKRLRAEWRKDVPPDFEAPGIRVWNDLGPGRDPRYRWQEATDVAALAVGTLAMAKRADLFSLADAGSAAMLRALRDRRPAWASSWLEHRIGRRGDNPIPEALSLGLLAEGIAELPVTLAGATQLRRLIELPSRESPPLAERLRDEPALRERLFLLFAHDGAAFGGPARKPKEGRPRDPARWTFGESLDALSRDGTLDRDELLDDAPAALAAPGRGAHLAGLLRLVRDLDASDAERAARPDAYLLLLAHREKNVAAFALPEAKRLHAGGYAPGVGVLAALPAALVHDVKTTGTRAVALAVAVAGREPALAKAAAAVLVDTLLHPKREVAAAAATALAGPLAAAGVASADRLSEAEALHPGVTEALAGTTRGPSAKTAAKVDGSRPAEDLPDADGIDARWLKVAGVERRGERWVVLPLAFDPAEVPYTAGLEPIEPIRTGEELLDAAARAVEAVDRPEDVERIVDAIVRFRGSRDGLDPDRLAVLRARVANERDPDRPYDPEEGTATAVGFDGEEIHAHYTSCKGAHVPLLGWLGVKLPPPKKTPSIGRTPSEVTDLRFEEAAAGPARPLLATPTHAGGWVTPAALVERMKELARIGLDPPPLDLQQALLRLTPDGRSEALPAAAELPGDTGRAARFALGSEAAGDRPHARDDPRFWLAAARSLRPTGPLPELSPLASELAAVDDLEEVRPPEIEAWQRELNDGRGRVLRTERRLRLRFTPGPRFEGGHLSDGLAKLSETGIFTSRAHRAWGVAQLGQTLPNASDGLLLGGAVRAVLRLDKSASTFDPLHVYAEPLFDKDRCWTPAAHLLAAVGLCVRDVPLRTAITDALLGGFEDGRARGVDLGEALVRLLPGGWVPLKRFCSGLAPVAAASPWHAREVQAAVEVALGAVPTDRAALLRLLGEAAARSGEPLRDETRVKLRESVEAAAKPTAASRAAGRLLVNAEGDPARAAEADAARSAPASIEPGAGKGRH